MTTVGALTWPIAPDSLIDMGGTADVADVAVERLVALDFGGKQVVELHGQPGLTTTKIADIISGAIGRAFPVALVVSEDDVARMMEAGIGRDFSILMNEAWETFSHGPVRESGRPGSRVLPQSIDRFIENVIAPAILAAPERSQPNSLLAADLRRYPLLGLQRQAAGRYATTTTPVGNISHETNARCLF